MRLPHRSAVAALSFLLGTAAWAGCSSESGRATTDADDVTSRPPGAGNPNAPPACKVVAMKDGHTLSAAEMRELDDPVSNFLLKGEGCPTTLTGIHEKLAKVDPCAETDRGLSTRFVSDRAQLLERPDDYRAVTNRACQGRHDGELLLSIFGIGTQTSPQGKVTAINVPETSIELIGEQRTTEGDKTTGVFNFYAREQNQWRFFGSSAEFVSSGYTCNADGACVPKAAAKQRCATCHTGGGLVMKELASPWVNWEGDRETPGIPEIVEKHSKLFGFRGDGVDLEGTVTNVNRNEWIPARIKIAKRLGLKEVLRPLFCTIEMNLDSSGSAPDTDQFFTSAFLVDPLFEAFLTEFTTGDDYTAALNERGQRIIDARTGRQLVSSNNAPAIDSVMGFTVPVKARQDNDYIRALIGERIVDVDFVKDVLAIDMSRPIFSPTRCALLDAAPDLPAAEMKADNVKAGFAKNLAALGTPPAKELAASIANLVDAGSHDFAAKKFMAACDERFKKEKPQMLRDILAYAAHVRSATKRIKDPAGAQGIIEFAETLPIDTQPEITTAFDPTTCKLR
jgi:hypothetical protein